MAAPKSAEDIRDLLAQTIVDTREGKLDRKRANAISYLSAGYLRALEVVDLEARLEALERQQRAVARREKDATRNAADIPVQLDGKSKTEPALDAGFSETMAVHTADTIQTPDAREASALLISDMIPPERVAKTIAEGMAAMETKFFSYEGVVQDQREVPAWSERRRYAELAAEYGGYSKSAKGEPGQSSPGVILILPSQGKELPSSSRVIPSASAQNGPVLSLGEGEEELLSVLEEWEEEKGE